MNYKDEKKAKVTLLQGAVRIDAGGAQNLLLSPGHQAEVDPETGGISEHVGEVSRTIAWTRGLMDLNNEDLGALMRQISRWYDVDVVFQGKVPKARIGGIIHRDVNLSIVLDYLEENGVRYTMKEKAILISP
jgi:ferric-dicitrate binding protein FerR (iron transport regulator)